MALTFKGGVHPYDGKSLTSSKPIKYVEPGDESIVFLWQHIGAPATPVVQVSDHVKKGQLIGEASGFISANIHSPVSGIVTKIDMRTHVSGDERQCIIIENDGLNDEVEYVEKTLDELSPQEIIERVKDAGVIGAGGAGFPTHVKLSPKEPDKIDHILVNAAECEPYLTCDHRFMLERPDEIVEGLKCMLKIFPKAKGYICIEDNKMECIENMQEIVKGEPNIEVAVCKTKYPQGAERCLINVVAKRELPATKLPADVGCIVDNVETVINIYQAAILGRPVITENMTVTGDDVTDPSNFEVPIGTSLHRVFDAAGGFIEEPSKILAGGPMMGPAMFTTEIPTSKGLKAILAFKDEEVHKAKESACINCGRCVNACPIRLMPTKLEKFASSNNEEGFEEFYGTECVECGSCTYICPAKRPLATQIRAMKKKIITKRRKK